MSKQTKPSGADAEFEARLADFENRLAEAERKLVALQPEPPVGTYRGQPHFHPMPKFPEPVVPAIDASAPPARHFNSRRP